MKQRRSRVCYGVQSCAFYRSGIGSGNNAYKDPMTDEWKASNRIIDEHKCWDSDDEKWYVQEALNWFIKKVSICLLIMLSQPLNTSAGRDCR